MKVVFFIMIKLHIALFGDHWIDLELKKERKKSYIKGKVNNDMIILSTSVDWIL